MGSWYVPIQKCNFNLLLINIPVISSVDLIIYWFQFQFFFRSMLFGRLAWHVLSTPLLQCWGISTGVSNYWRFVLLPKTQTTSTPKNGGLSGKMWSRSTLSRKMMHLLYLASSLCCLSLKLSWLLVWQKSAIQATTGLNSPPSQCTLCTIRYGINGIVKCDHIIKHTRFLFLRHTWEERGIDIAVV